VGERPSVCSLALSGLGASGREGGGGRESGGSNSMVVPQRCLASEPARDEEEQGKEGEVRSDPVVVPRRCLALAGAR
jgi:hypothetical protein